MESIKALILDFQQTPLQTGVPRHLALTPMPGKAAVCIGVRRCGKSTYLLQIAQQLLANHVPMENLLYLNFFDDRLHHLQQMGLGAVLEAYFSLYPEKKGKEKVYCFFDEIQMIPQWESFIDRLLRTETCEVYLTGSSAQMLSTEIATQMRGRALSWEMFPFSFQEFLDFQGISAQGALSTKQRLLVQKAFTQFWETGGFPEVLGVSPQLRVKTHQEYFHAVLFRDLVERHDVSHPKAVVDLARWLMDNNASLYSVNRLTGFLKSLGHKVPKSAVSDYLHWFEDAYFLFSVRLFDASQSRSQANPKKIYCVDHAMVRSVSTGILLNEGHLLENLVFVALRRHFAEVFYYKTQNGKEVDFIIPQRGQPPKLVQVCETLAAPKTRKRELQALSLAMAEQGTTQGLVVTKNESETIATEVGEIQVLPAWRFLLQMEGVI